MCEYELSFSFNNAYTDVSLNNHAFTFFKSYGFITVNCIKLIGDDDNVREQIQDILNDLSITIDNRPTMLYSDVIDRFNIIFAKGLMDIDIKGTAQNQWEKFLSIRLRPIIKSQTPSITKQYTMDSKVFIGMRDELTAVMYQLANLRNRLILSKEKGYRIDNDDIIQKMQDIWDKLDTNVLKTLSEE